jgi:uncharacterized membrane protein YdfJ with MMPL/SSD domain
MQTAGEAKMRKPLVQILPAIIAVLLAQLDLQLPSKPPSYRGRGHEAVWSRFVAIITNGTLLGVTAFCLFLLLLFLILILSFPDLGAIVEQYNKF